MRMQDIRQLCDACGSGILDDCCGDCGHIGNDASCVCDHCVIRESNDDDEQNEGE
jgi:hypothetical protein